MPTRKAGWRMTETTTYHRYRRTEERVNSITHGVGIILAIAGLGVLTTSAGVSGNLRHMVGVSVFGLTLILMYTASTLYHGVRNPRAKAILQTFDHCAIFLLIAGTYTPFTLVTLYGPWGWSLFGVVWGLAVFGIVVELTPLRRYRALSLGLYLGMGWAVVAAIKPMLAGIAPGGLFLLLAGGLSYTVGISFYLLRKLAYHHAIWHLFVLAGSIFHFFAVLFYVVPVADF
ncbi:MAG: hemolysin III family protein [Desulfosarcina sp.]|nr:hemolysin III family protein [Desulfosarcina sp.]